MKLINAEKLKKELTGWETEPTDEAIEYTIDRQPVVDAIPVEWVEKYVKKSYRKAKEHRNKFAEDCACGVDLMLDDWRKENE